MIAPSADHKPSHVEVAAVAPDVIADALAKLPDFLAGIHAEMPGVSIEDEMIVTDHMMKALKDRGMAMIHVHVDFLSMDSETARETLDTMLPARDGSDGRTVIVLSSMGTADRQTLRLIDEMIMDATCNNGRIPQNAKILLLRSTSSHSTGVLTRLFKMNVLLPAVTDAEPGNRRRREWQG